MGNNTDPSTDNGDELPFTTDELSEKERGAMSLPDQVRYAIFNGNYRIKEICEVTTFSPGWTTDIIEDMVDEDELFEGSDQHGLFYALPHEMNNQGLSADERDELHEQALKQFTSRTTIGDEKDMEAHMQSGSEQETPETPETAADADADAESVHADAAATETTTTTNPTPTGDDTVSGPTADSEDIAEAKSKNGGRLPVDRRYDWNKEKLDPAKVADYISANGEKEDIIRQIEDRRTTGKSPHFRLVGPTGCGKTTLPQNIAVGMDAPCFIIECHEGLRPNNLLGMPTYVGDETWWVDGPLTKALLASKERPVVLIFDEVNRTTSRTLGIIMSALDHRGQVTLNARGGEKIQGDPMNLLVFSTMNQGDGYVTNRIDIAQLRRLGNTFPTDYIGMYDVSEEAKLITDRTPVSKDVATELVECANSIRKKADERDSSLSIGIPTSVILDWARTAWSYRDNADADGGPLVKAGQESVIDLFYRGDEDSVDVVTTTIESHLRGMEIDYEETTASEEDPAGEATIDISDETWLMCESCGWYAESEDADDDVVTTMQCPECDHTLTPREAT